MKNNNAFMMLLGMWLVFLPMWGMESPTEKRREIIAWPTTAKEQVEYIERKKWDIPTKTYILQLLFENARKKLYQVRIQEQANVRNQMGTFNYALLEIGQNPAAISEDKKLRPQFTYQLTKIPKDVAPELKEILVKSLDKQQKQMIINRANINRKLSEHNVALKYKEKLSKQDYIQHKKLLEEYLQILLPQDQELEEKIIKAIGDINAKLSNVEQREQKLLEVEREQQKIEQLKEEASKRILEQSKIYREREIQKEEVQRQQNEKKLKEDIDQFRRELEQKEQQKKLMEEAEKEQKEKEERLAQQERLRLIQEGAQQQVKKEKQEKEKIESQQWIPWMRKQTASFFSAIFNPIASTITSWWSWLMGRQEF